MSQIQTIFTDVSDEVLDMKAGLCRELLHLLEVLNAGQCRLRGKWK